MIRYMLHPLALGLFDQIRETFEFILVELAAGVA